MNNYSQSILFQLSTRAPASSATITITAFSTTTTRTADYTGRNTFLKFWSVIWNAISSEMASLHNSIDQINVTLTKLYQWLFWKFNTILPWFQMKSTFLYPNILLLNYQTGKNWALQHILIHVTTTIIGIWNKNTFLIKKKKWFINRHKDNPPCYIKDFLFCVFQLTD